MKRALVMGLVLAGLLIAFQAYAADDNLYNIVRSQDLIGKSVKNDKGDDLGRVEDYVINLKDGSIAYGVLQHGGTLGFGGRLFAIPPQAMSLSQDMKFVRLNVEKGELEKAAGFDANKWPTEADARWGKGAANKEPGRDEEPKKDEGKKDDAGRDDDKAAHLRRVSSLIGVAVKNEKGDDLGSVQGIVFDLKANKVLYAGMAYGGVAGVGSKYFAVPWEAMKLQSPTLKASDQAFLVNVDKSELENAKGFDAKTWPTTPDKIFTSTNKPNKP